MRSCNAEASMRWITRAHPKIDRVACPWLITRFIDPQAEFLFAPLFPDDHELLARGFVIYDAPRHRLMS